MPVEAPIKVTLFNIVTSCALFKHRPVDNDDEDAIRLLANRLAKARLTGGPRFGLQGLEDSMDVILNRLRIKQHISRDQGTGTY